MKDINTYIQEGFYKNAGTTGFTNFLKSFSEARECLLNTSEIKGEDILNYIKTISRWTKFRNIVATFPKDYGFAIITHDIHCRFKYNFHAYVSRDDNDGNAIVFGFFDSNKPFFGPKGEIKVAVPFSNWVYTYTNSDLLNFYERIERGYIDKIYDIYPIKYTPDGEKSFEVIQY